MDAPLACCIKESPPSFIISKWPTAHAEKDDFGQNLTLYINAEIEQYIYKIDTDTTAVRFNNILKISTYQAYCFRPALILVLRSPVVALK